MNERIRELATEVGISLDYLENTKQIVLIEKFAELIVRECMLCCDRVISDPVPESVDTWLDGGLQCISEIKQHFGVTE